MSTQDKTRKPRGRADLFAISITLFPLAGFCFFLALKLLRPAAYHDLIQEDAALENIQAVLYLVASGVAFATFARLRRSGRVLLWLPQLLLALGLLFVCLEEISWGQRIFDLQTPPLLDAYNAQHEITVHNLRPIQGVIIQLYMLVGLYGCCGWLLLRRLSGRARELLSFCVPPRRCCLYFLAVFSTYGVLYYCILVAGNVVNVCGHRLCNFFQWRDQEPVELMLALGFLLFVLDNRKRSGVLAARPAA